MPPVTRTSTRSAFPGVRHTLTKPLTLLRLLQLLATCASFSLVASVGAYSGPMGYWAMFTWCFCFAVTLIIIAVELCEFEHLFPLSWTSFPITYACYAALFCLSTSIIYPTTYVQHLSRGQVRDQAIAACVCSIVAFLAYAYEVSWTRARPGEVTVYMATVSGLLKVVETFVACVIFAFLSETTLYTRHATLEWCVAVYAMCFILSAVAIILNLCDCTNELPIPFPSFLSALALISVLFYISAMVLWPLYQFDSRFGGQAQRSRDISCRGAVGQSICIWDRRMAITILTAINLLTYLTDLVYSSRLSFFS
ncbi:PREDICTED: myeloid-associated differentiation marker [Elephantulus edwardii]|uniref:myeloid-associated differentiation marker n=1 Tax=Elephantulus edwardii TaxID=28737 RepID=UPI0003F0EEB2|nr:PREDICTED: myeloid-associated differentiation marker [Elephantulus edwardii]